MTSRILCINPWIYDFAAYNLWSAPLGLLYIASTLRGAGHQVDYVDCLDRQHPAVLDRPGSKALATNAYGCGKYLRTIVPKPEVVRHVPRHYARYGIPLDVFDKELSRLSRPDVILVTSVMTYWYLGPFEAIRRARARFPGVPIVLGGIYATLCRQHAIAHSGADLVVSGPGEREVLRIVGELTGQGREDTSSEDLDALPYPAFDLLPKLDSVAVMTSRGCPLRCTYCASHLLNPEGFRRRDPMAVIEEIAHWRLRHDVQDFAFYDDALLVDAAHHIGIILEEVLRRGLRCRFHTPNGLHARLIDAGLADLMHRAGFKTIRLSLETIDAERQRAIGPKVSAAQVGDAVARLKAAGFEGRDIGVYILMGLPGQPLHEIAEGIGFVHSLGVHANIALYTPIPGTTEWTRAVQAGVIDPDADPLLHNNSIYPTLPGHTAEACQRIKDLAREGNRSII